MKTSRTGFVATSAIIMAFVLVLTLAPPQGLQAVPNATPEVSHDGLHRVEDSIAAIAYIKPDADFSVYDRFTILDCYVAFKKDWQRDHNRASPGNRVSDSDMQRIKEEMADLFREVFVEELSENDGYEVVDGAAGDVLLIRPAIIDLVASAPDTMSAGRSKTFVNSAGAATLFIELYDSVTGEILARAIDRKADRGSGMMQWSTSARNRMEARKIIRGWADTLRERMDEIHGNAT